MKFVILLLAGYLLGCVNFSIILTKRLEKKDVRDFGSGNAGFTNTLRNFKRKTAVMVFAGDALKAVVAVLLAKLLMPGNQYAMFAASLGTILGHNFPVFYGFRGGKGVLVSVVGIFFTDYRIGFIVLIGSVFIMFATGYVSLGSLSGASLFPILTAIVHTLQAEYIVFAVLIALLNIFMHRSNIVRLAHGKENCFKKH